MESLTPRPAPVTASAVCDRLRDPLLKAAWDSILASWTEGSEYQRAELLRWVRDSAEHFAQFAEDVQDEEELNLYVGLRFIEAMSQWQMLNTQINYQVARRGFADPVLQYKSLLLSTVTDALAQIVPPSQMDAIRGVIATPFPRAA